MNSFLILHSEIYYQSFKAPCESHELRREPLSRDAAQTPGSSRNAQGLVRLDGDRVLSPPKSRAQPLWNEDILVAD